MWYYGAGNMQTPANSEELHALTVKVQSYSLALFRVLGLCEGDVLLVHVIYFGLQMQISSQ